MCGIFLLGWWRRRIIVKFSRKDDGGRFRWKELSPEKLV
jgi:hypothetical protein